MATITGQPAAFWALPSIFNMSFQSVHYLVFLPVVVGAYGVLPQKARRAWLLLASYYFYFCAAPDYLVVLLCGTLFSYLLGLLVGGPAKKGLRRAWLLCGVIGLVAGLAFFKYNGFFRGAIEPLFASVGLIYPVGYFVTAKALGISFYTFMAIGYLIDVYRADVPPQKNLLTHALFLGFFAAVTQGPISRAGSLMPQLAAANASFSARNTANSLLRMALGFFKKLAVADTLAVFTTAVFQNPAGYGGISLALAAVLFAVQLYFDFSGYTDIALGSAGLLGIQLPENFANPYFATNFSGFWARWHISLSSWLQDYIFTPLVWSRWTEHLPFIGKRVKNPPVLSSIAVVFLVSGLWHGDALCFLVWGALQAVFRIGEELLHRRLGKPKKRPPLPQRIGKTAVVLVLWTASLVFFAVGLQSGSLADALGIFARLFSPGSLWQAARDLYAAAYAGVYPKTIVVAAFWLFSAVCTALALWADWVQCFRWQGKGQVQGILQQRTAVRWSIYYALVLGCFAAFLLQSGGFGGTSFLYAGF